MLNTISNHIIDSPTFTDNTTIDNPQRLEFIQSSWKSIWYRKEQSILYHALEKEIKTLFHERYGFKENEHKVFNRIWHLIGAHKIWRPSSVLTAGTLRQIDHLFKTKLVYQGPGISPPLEQSPNSSELLKLFTKALLHGHSFTSDILHKKFIKAVFVKKNPELLQELFHELQNELNNLAANPPPPDDKQQEFIWRIFLGNVMALIPFTYPTDGTILFVPLLENGKCKLVEYSIKVMPLALTELATPMTALGMTPKNDPEAPPILCYLATTYPAGNGAATTLLADFTPAHSVGEAVYNVNSKQIDDWLGGKQNVLLFGTSLGGAMCFHTLCQHADKIKRMDVYNPPGLFENCWNKSKEISNAEVNIYWQAGDLVANLGSWPESSKVSLYYILTLTKNLENFISSHARAFTGCPCVFVVKLDPEYENKSRLRFIVTCIHKTGSYLIYLVVACTIIFWHVIKKAGSSLSQFYQSLSKHKIDKNK